MPHILSVSYDASLLRGRQLILEGRGYRVVSACGFREALDELQIGSDYALFILGHSIPHEDKEALIAAFRGRCSAPVLALRRLDEADVRGADLVVDPDPAELVAAVSKLVPPNHVAASGE